MKAWSCCNVLLRGEGLEREVRVFGGLQSLSSSSSFHTSPQRLCIRCISMVNAVSALELWVCQCVCVLNSNLLRFNVMFRISIVLLYAYMYH